MDNETPKWPWGCGVQDNGEISHERNIHPETELWVGPEEWANSRLNILERDKTLPDYSNSDVLLKEAGGSLCFEEVFDNIKKQNSSQFKGTKREDWLAVQGHQFHQMMTGNYGAGIQGLDFDIGDLMMKRRNCTKRGRSYLFRSNDLDSGLGWLPDLGSIKSDLSLYLYPISSRNFDANIHLFMDIGAQKVPVHHVNHFLLGQFGSLSTKQSFDLYLFLPALYDKKSKGNGVSDRLKNTFISECLIPAAREILPDFILQQFGMSMGEVKMDVEAPIYESQTSGPAGHRLGGEVNIPEEYLKELWEKTLRRIRRGRNPDLEMFEGCRLFWNFKGLKYCLNAKNSRELKETLEDKVRLNILG
jgi:hypothetical protein